MNHAAPRIFIVDDEAPARARLTTLLADIEAECPHQLAGSADHAQAAFEGIAQARPDIVLLDVQMPGMTGIELAAHLAKTPGGAPAVIFVTAYDEYALKAFEVHALDYLMKPVRAARLADAIRRVASLRAGAQQPGIAAAASQLQPRRKHFSVQERDRMLLVPVGEVLYLKAELKYVTVRTKTHQYLIEESLTSLEAEFSSLFIRVHRNALVARDAIAGVEKGVAHTDADQDGREPGGEQERGQEAWQVIIRGIDDRLPISRRQWPAVKALVR
jgi:two-component system response regulator AlgR